MPDDLYAGIEANLSRLPEDVSRTVRHNIRLAREAGIGSLERLAEAARSTPSEVNLQLAACDLLGRLGDSYRHSAEALAELFADSENREVIWESAKAVALMGAGHVAEALVAHVDGADTEKAKAAAWALGRLGNPVSADSLRTVLRDAGAHPDVRAHVAEALGNLASRDAVNDLVGALADLSVEVRYWAAYALGQIGDLEAIPALERTAASDHGVAASGSIAAEATAAIELIRNLNRR